MGTCVIFYQITVKLEYCFAQERGIVLCTANAKFPNQLHSDLAEITISCSV